MPDELLAALKEIQGNKERSKYLADLIEAEAKRQGISVSRPASKSAVVKTAFDCFVASNKRPPTMKELQAASNLTYVQVWRAVHDLQLRTLTRAEHNKVRKSAES